MSTRVNGKGRPLGSTLACVAVLATSGLLAGCGQVALEGTIFDALGVSPQAQAAAKEEKELKPRAGIVMPPSVDRLPEPGSAPEPGAIAAIDGSFPVNPEDRANAELAQKEAEHRAFCEKALLEQRTFGRSELIMGPMGQCNPSILKNVTGKTAGEAVGGS